MARPCQTCQHPARSLIEEMLKEEIPFLYILKNFNISEQALYRHKKLHMTLPEKPKKGETVAIFEHVSSSNSWHEYSLADGEKVIGSLYLIKDLQPVNKSIRLKKRSGTGMIDFKL